jgi:hypothetical protein
VTDNIRRGGIDPPHAFFIVGTHSGDTAEFLRCFLRRQLRSLIRLFNDRGGEILVIVYATVPSATRSVFRGS